MARRRPPLAERDGHPYEYLVTVSPTGQITLPADIRRQVQALGRRQLLLKVLDATRGVYQMEPAGSLGDLLASFKWDSTGSESFGDRYLREKAEEADIAQTMDASN